MDYRKKLIVKPGAKVRLKDIDPAWHGQHEDQKAAVQETAGHLAHLAKQQRMLYGEKRHAVLIVLQGIDAAGKDGVCWHVMKGMNPQGVSVTGFKQPTPEERAQDFLWRVHPHAPGLGQVAVFNRSHYEDVLVARVHKAEYHATEADPAYPERAAAKEKVSKKVRRKHKDSDKAKTP